MTCDGQSTIVGAVTAVVPLVTAVSIWPLSVPWALEPTAPPMALAVQ